GLAHAAEGEALGGVDHHRPLRLTADEGDHAVGAGGGVLMGAVVTVDDEVSHPAIVQRECDTDRDAPPAQGPQGTVVSARRISASAARRIRDTCGCEMPMRAAISSWERSS